MSVNAMFYRLRTFSIATNFNPVTLLFKWTIAVVLILLWQADSFSQSVKPKYIYLSDYTFNDTSSLVLNGPARLVSHQSRTGVNITSIKSTIKLKNHTLAGDHGTVSIWFMPLEDLSAYDPKPNMSKSNANFYNYTFLSDCSVPQAYERGNFKLAWTPRWHPSLTALFAQGTFYEEAFNLPHKAFVSVSHVVFKSNTWYQLTLTWDYTRDQYNLYLNGILIGRENQFNSQKFYRDKIGPYLYTGNPSLCVSTIKFYDSALSAKKIHEEFKSSCTSFDQELENELIETYDGHGKGKFNWQPDGRWQKKLSIDFNKSTDLDSLYVQGKPVKVDVNKDGLLIETIDKLYTGKLLDSQAYVWTKRPFEGDLYVEYEFKVLRPGGLSLLMVQASGMNREDFMADYPLRTGGRMTTVYGEDVRNYHWEYYREMADMRNDISNSALMKNPFLYPLSFSAINTPVSKDTWHKLQFLQIGNKLTGAIDGVKVVEFNDDGFKNNGPVYNYGRIAIRCMLHTKMLFKNLRIYNKKDFKVQVIPQ